MKIFFLRVAIVCIEFDNGKQNGCRSTGDRVAEVLNKESRIHGWCVIDQRCVCGWNSYVRKVFITAIRIHRKGSTCFGGVSKPQSKIKS